MPIVYYLLNAYCNIVKLYNIFFSYLIRYIILTQFTHSYAKVIIDFCILIVKYYEQIREIYFLMFDFIVIILK